MPRFPAATNDVPAPVFVQPSIFERRRGRFTFVLMASDYRIILKTRQHWHSAEEAGEAAQEAMDRMGWIRDPEQ